MRAITLIVLFISSILYTSAEIHTLPIGQFDKIKISGNLTVVYKNLPDSTGVARYEAPAGNSQLFKLDVNKNGLLKVSPGDDSWTEKDLPVLYIYSDFLSSVESYSEKDVQISGLIPTAIFKVNLIGNGSIYVDDIKSTEVSASLSTGNGSIYLTGSCEEANFKMIGTGLISADQLQAENVKCHILGTGSIGCWPIDNLKVSGLGSTKIYYKGSPNISKKGGGKLYELPKEDVGTGGAELRSLNPSVHR